LDVGYSRGTPGDEVKKQFGYSLDHKWKTFGGIVDLMYGHRIKFCDLSVRTLIDWNGNEKDKPTTNFDEFVTCFCIYGGRKIFNLSQHEFYLRIGANYTNAAFDSLGGSTKRYRGHIMSPSIGGAGIFKLRNKPITGEVVKAFDQIFWEISYDYGYKQRSFKELRSSIAVLLFPNKEFVLVEIGYQKIGNNSIFKASHFFIGARWF
jgi:hypothetical protein